MKNPVDFYDIYDYYYTPVWQTAWFKITLAVVAASLVTGLFVYFLLRRKAHHISAWEWAEKQLTKFALDKLESKNDFKKFYFDLTSIIKTYLHKRFDWSTQDKTDEELIMLLEKKKFDQELITMIQKTAEGALWIKYANEAALRSQAQEDLKTARRLIEKTKETNKEA